jgi:hypothetical protein
MGSSYTGLLGDFGEVDPTGPERSGAELERLLGVDLG